MRIGFNNVSPNFGIIEKDAMVEIIVKEKLGENEVDKFNKMVEDHAKSPARIRMTNYDGGGRLMAKVSVTDKAGVTKVRNVVESFFGELFNTPLDFLKKAIKTGEEMLK